MSKLLSGVKSSEEFVVAFESFNHCRRERTQKLVKTSKECGQLYEMELHGVKDNLDKLKQNLQCRMKWIWDHDLDIDVAEGRRYILEHTPARTGEARL